MRNLICSSIRYFTDSRDTSIIFPQFSLCISNVNTWPSAHIVDVGWPRFECGIRARLWRLLPEVLREFYSLHTQNNKILSKMSTNVHALVYMILLRYMSLNKVLIATAQMRTCCVASTNRLPHNAPRTGAFISPCSAPTHPQATVD